MHPRNLHLYFFSPTGGTQRVAGLFAENLNAADACTDITVHAEAKTFSADDCLLVFFPVYGGRVPGPCLARMRACAGRTLRPCSWPCSATAPWTTLCSKCAIRSPRWAFA